MCTGIVNDKYCEFPNSILQEEDEIYIVRRLEQEQGWSDVIFFR